MKFLARSTWKFFKAVLSSPFLNVWVIIITVILMIPYWPIGFMSQALLKEDQEHGDCPAWLRKVLQTADMPRQGILQWGNWINTQ